MNRSMAIQNVLIACEDSGIAEEEAEEVLKALGVTTEEITQAIADMEGDLEGEMRTDDED